MELSTCFNQILVTWTGMVYSTQRFPAHCQLCNYCQKRLLYRLTQLLIAFFLVGCGNSLGDASNRLFAEAMNDDDIKYKVIASGRNQPNAPPPDEKERMTAKVYEYFAVPTNPDHFKQYQQSLTIYHPSTGSIFKTGDYGTNWPKAFPLVESVQLRTFNPLIEDSDGFDKYLQLNPIVPEVVELGLYQQDNKFTLRLIRSGIDKDYALLGVPAVDGDKVTGIKILANDDQQTELGFGMPFRHGMAFYLYGNSNNADWPSPMLMVLGKQRDLSNDSDLQSFYQSLTANDKEFLAAQYVYNEPEGTDRHYYGNFIHSYASSEGFFTNHIRKEIFTHISFKIKSNNMEIESYWLMSEKIVTAFCSFNSCPQYYWLKLTYQNTGVRLKSGPGQRGLHFTFDRRYLYSERRLNREQEIVRDYWKNFVVKGAVYGYDQESATIAGTFVFEANPKRFVSGRHDPFIGINDDYKYIWGIFVATAN